MASKLSLRQRLVRSWQSLVFLLQLMQRGPDYIAHPTRGDVLRIARRDFPWHTPDEVLSILDQYGTETWHKERERVHAAILKVSGGDFSRLSSLTEAAKGDYRDLLAAAEYPAYSRIGFVELDRMPAKEVRRIKAGDWRQYEAWLRQGAAR